MSDSKPEGRPKQKIESLSDMIFGLALSVGAITLVGNPPSTSGGLYNDILTFGFSFLILISVWMRYTKIMSVLPLENRRSVSLNTLLLFIVSIEPFLFNLVRSTNPNAPGDFANVVSISYGVDLGVMMLILGFFTSVLVDEEKKLIPRELQREFTYEMITMYVAGALFIGSALLPLTIQGIGGQPLRFDIWIFPFIISTIRRRSRDAIKEMQKLRSHSNSPESQK
jgi:uncharacterized membrane protein